jgi:hypothetical protein
MCLARSIVLVALCSAALSTAAQAELVQERDVSFEYSAPLVRCVPGRRGSLRIEWWAPETTCSPQLCEDQATPNVEVVACVAYPADEFRRKVAFAGAAFSLLEVRSASADDDCLAGDPDWPIAERGEALIDDYPAEHFRLAEAWTSHHRQAEVYRVFANDRCFQLRIERVYRSTAPYQAGSFEDFTPQDDAKVQSRLQEVLQSVRFADF